MKTLFLFFIAALFIAGACACCYKPKRTNNRYKGL